MYEIVRIRKYNSLGQVSQRTDLQDLCLMHPHHHQHAPIQNPFNSTTFRLMKHSIQYASIYGKIGNIFVVLPTCFQT